MSDFAVDLDALTQIISSLNQSDEQLETAMRAMSDKSGANLGTGQLNDAADDFQHKWAYGVKQIESMVKDTTGAMTKVRDQYQQAETSLADGLNQITQAL